MVSFISKFVSNLRRIEFSRWSVRRYPTLCPFRNFASLTRNDPRCDTSLLGQNAELFQNKPNYQFYLSNAKYPSAPRWMSKIFVYFSSGQRFFFLNKLVLLIQWTNVLASEMFPFELFGKWERTFNSRFSALWFPFFKRSGVKIFSISVCTSRLWTKRKFGHNFPSMWEFRLASKKLLWKSDLNKYKNK